MRANTGGGSKKAVTPNGGQQGAGGAGRGNVPNGNTPAPRQLTPAEIEQRARIEHQTRLAIEQEKIVQEQRKASEDARILQTQQARALIAQQDEEAEPEQEEVVESKQEDEKLTFSQKMVGALTAKEKELPRKKRKSILLKRRAVRVTAVVIVAAALAGGVKMSLDRWVYPAVDYVSDASLSGAGALESWSLAINSADSESIKGIVPKSFLAQEEGYTYFSETRTEFIRSVIGTVSYDIPTVDRKTVYGKPVTKKVDDEEFIVTGPSDVMNGEEVKLNYIDYASIPVDAKSLKQFVKDEKFNVKDPDVSQKLTDLYAKYINSLAKTEEGLPKKEIDWVPNFDTHDVTNDKGKTKEGLIVSLDEDVALDNLLFASNEFWMSQYEFSKAVLGGEGSKDYEKWVGVTKKAEEVAAKAKLEKEAKAKAAADEKKQKEEDAKQAKEDKAAADKEAAEDAKAAEEAKKESDEPSEPVESGKAPAEGASNKTGLVIKTVVDEPSKATEGATSEPTEKSTAEPTSKSTSKSTAKPTAKPSKDAEEEEDTSSNFPPGMAGNETHTTARPAVGNHKYIDPFWIGAYYLKVGMVDYAKSHNVEVKPITDPVGLGTVESTAGLNASLLTVQFDEVDGKEVKTPIRVEMLSILKDQKAINFFQSKDTRNRGFLSDSQVKYIALTYKVTNLSDKEATIRDNSSLSDDQVNITGTTGNVFGLKTELKLKAGESGVIESWAASPTLGKSFIVWGKDFSRRADVIWFRQLAGETGTVNRQEGIDDAPDLAPEDKGTTEDGELEEVAPQDESTGSETGSVTTPKPTTGSTGTTEDDGS